MIAILVHIISAWGNVKGLVVDGCAVGQAGIEKCDVVFVKNIFVFNNTQYTKPYLAKNDASDNVFISKGHFNCFYTFRSQRPPCARPAAVIYNFAAFGVFNVKNLCADYVLLAYSRLD